MATRPSGAGMIPKLNVVILGESLASEEDDLVFPGHDFSQQAHVPSPQKVKVEKKTWKVDAGSRTVDLELTTLSSTHHVELNPSDDGFQERYIVQEIIKEMAKNRPIDVKGKKGFKVLVLNEVDKLSREAQHSLRRTIENFRATETS